MRIGPQYPGAAHLELQRVLLALKDRGVLLAVASKNNPADALEVLEKHPAMLLRPRDFAALRISWAEKEESLREIARELGIGLDALVFLDDSPVERERVRTALPEVLVPELPADPMGYAEAVLRLPVFERLSLSAEDRTRDKLYKAQQERTALQQSAHSLEDFYRSLEMEMTIAPLAAATRARVAQLTQKTNQLNLTTRRYGEEEIERMGFDPAVRIFTCALRDRFGDNGLVGVVIVRTGDPIWEIDTLLLSCRVIGGTVETALLAHLVAQARAAGALALRGWYLSTSKNEPAREVYPRHGFRFLEERGKDRLFELTIAAASLAPPPWIKVRE